MKSFLGYRDLSFYSDVRLYLQYGRLLGLNSYLKSPDPLVTKRIFEKQRGSGRSHPKKVGDYEVTAVRDLTLGYDSRTGDGRAELPLNLGGAARR